MVQPTLDIDRLVREVLAQLGLPAAETAAPLPSAPVAPAAPVAPPASTGNGALVVTQRVVSLAGLNGRLDGVRQLVVPPQAIVTPSVRDELRRRHITLLFARPAATASQSDTGRLVLVVAGSYDPSVLAAGLSAEGLAVDVRRTDCLMKASDLLAAELARAGTLGVLATRHVAAGICLTNRLAGLRAVAGLDPATVADEASSVGANLLVVNPAAFGLQPLKLLVLQFCHHAGHECPEVFCQRLG